MLSETETENVQVGEPLAVIAAMVQDDFIEEHERLSLPPIDLDKEDFEALDRIGWRVSAVCVRCGSARATANHCQKCLNEIAANKAKWADRERLAVEGQWSMDLTHPDSSVIKSILSAVSMIVENPDWIVNEKGIYMSNMDSSHVAMAILSLPPPAFEDFTVKGDMIFRTENLHEIVQKLFKYTKHDPMKIKWEGATRILTFMFFGKCTKTYALKTVDPVTDRPPIPNIPNLTVRAKLLVDTLLEAVQAASEIGEGIAFEATTENLQIKAVGTDYDSSCVRQGAMVFDKGSEALLDLEVKEPTRAQYSRDYLLTILKAAKQAAEVVTIEYSKDMPLKVTVELPPPASLVFWTAPRIEETE